ncbi:hypothetical protein HG530_013070 [Fusarium avenaceum]|nr:hypothetical protein HG530_013070 [Fusarium avenaceum]
MRGAEVLKSLVVLSRCSNEDVTETSSFCNLNSHDANTACTAPDEDSLANRVKTGNPGSREASTDDIEQGVRRCVRSHTDSTGIFGRYTSWNVIEKLGLSHHQVLMSSQLPADSAETVLNPELRSLGLILALYAES